MTAIAPGNRGGALDRFLRLFSDVRAGEGTTAIILTANVFLLLSAYYVIKPVREALILTGAAPRRSPTPRPARPSCCSVWCRR